MGIIDQFCHFHQESTKRDVEEPSLTVTFRASCALFLAILSLLEELVEESLRAREDIQE